LGNKKIEEYLKNDPHTGYILKSHGDWDWQVYTATETQQEFYAMLRRIRSDLAESVRDISTLLVIQDFKFDFTPRGIVKILKSLKD